MSITPLYIDEHLESTTKPPPQGICEKLISLWLMPFTEPAFGRTSVEHQLQNRTEFPQDSWSQVDVPLEFVVRLLEVVQKEMRHPNHHYIPEDSIPMVLRPETEDEIPTSPIRVGIRAEFGIEYTFDELRRMHIEGNWTIGRLARDLYSRAAGT